MPLAFAAGVLVPVSLPAALVLALTLAWERPVPLPSRARAPVVTAPWVVRMRWHDLCFLHWPVDPPARAAAAAGLELDIRAAPRGSASSRST